MDRGNEKQPINKRKRKAKSKAFTDGKVSKNKENEENVLENQILSKAQNSIRDFEEVVLSKINQIEAHWKDDRESLKDEFESRLIHLQLQVSKMFQEKKKLENEYELKLENYKSEISTFHTAQRLNEEKLKWEQVIKVKGARNKNIPNKKKPNRKTKPMVIETTKKKMDLSSQKGFTQGSQIQWIYNLETGKLESPLV